MPQNIDQTDFIIFDTETTGLEFQGGDRIVEIACLRLRQEKVIAEFHSLINPGREISPAAFAVNKITPAMLRSAPGTEEAITGFLEFIKGGQLCAYNAGFDLGFLNNELLLSGRGPLKDTPVIDILRMARRLLPGLERYALWYVAESLGIKERQEHRALADVYMTLGVFRRLKKKLLSKGISDLDSLFGLFGLNSRLVNDILGRKISEIQQAIDLGVAVKIRYLSGASQVTEREVMPQEIRQEAGRHYLRGYCSLRKEERSFRVDGILHLEIV
jgi:DNA polymerase-3 subunit epsilon